MSGARPPLGALSANDHGPIVLVFAVASSWVSVCIITVRIFVAARRKLEFRSDDALILAALCLSIAQSTTWGFAVKNGLGRHISAVTDGSLIQYFKFTYSSQVLGIFAMSFSKASIALLIRRLSVYHSSFFRSSVPIACVGIWAIFSLFASILQCNLPNPWFGALESCPTRERLWSAILILNIISDALLAIYIIPGVSRLHMPKPMRLTVVGLFATRLLVCVASGVQLAHVIQHARTEDPTWDSLTFAILADVTVHLSLITATIPRIHSFLIALQTGRTAARIEAPDGVAQRFGFRAYFKEKTQNSSTISRSDNNNTQRSVGTDPQSLRLVPEHERGQFSTRIYSSHSGGSNTNVSAVSSELQAQSLEMHDLESRNAPHTPKQSTINKRHEITVNIEYRNGEVVRGPDDQYHAR